MKKCLLYLSKLKIISLQRFIYHYLAKLYIFKDKLFIFLFPLIRNQVYLCRLPSHCSNLFLSGILEHEKLSNLFRKEQKIALDPK